MRVGRETWTRGEWLDWLSLHGSPPLSGSIQDETVRQNRAAVGVAPGRPLKEALFLTSTEAYALMILFTCAWGYNGSVVASMTVGADRADDRDAETPIYLVELDKPRRGARSRFFSNAFVGERAALWENAVSLTQPARDTLGALGHPTDKLVVSIAASSRSAHPTGLFRTDWSEPQGASRLWNRSAGVVGDDGLPLRVTLSRLRLSEQVINEKASQNSPAVSESVYRYPDAQTHAEARQVVLQGQADALAHARATVAMRAVTRSELAAARTDPTSLAQKLGVEPGKALLLVQGQLDTATGACLDYGNTPFAESPGQPCRSSFLNCFACPNAVAAPRHLPRLVVLHDALVGISDAVSQQEWQDAYAAHFARLTDLLALCANDSEISQARASATSADRETAESLLRGEFDR